MTTGSARPAEPELVVRGDGVRIAVHRYPLAAGHQAVGPPVILVHGLGSDAATNWVQAGWVRALHRIGRAAVGFDLRGHGRSDHPQDEDRYRVALLVGDLRAVLDEVFAGTAVENGPVDAIGYSLGARVLLEFVGDEPTPIRRLVLGGTAGQPQLQGIDVELIDRAVRGGPMPVDGETGRIARTISALPTNDAVALSFLVRGLNADPDTARRTPDPALPTLLAVGTDDPLHALSQRWSASLPAAEFVSIPGRDHVSAVPSAVFRSAAMEFLTRG